MNIVRLFNSLWNNRNATGTWVSPGHFYSPIPNPDDVKKRRDQIFDRSSADVSGINLNPKEQLALLNEFKTYYRELPFTAEKTEKTRYFFENDFYSYSDAIFLYSVIRHFRPKRIVEVGSGFSSFCILDTNETFFSNKIQCQFIEPYPDRLFSQLKASDREDNEVLVKELQDVELDFFQQLDENDLLVIDSTHVAKTGSDVNRIFFDILPQLKKGVLIHFHDIFFPFEYPESWVYEGRAWNESYLLRAFLQYNDCFKVVLFNTYLAQFFTETFEKEFPLCLKNTGGSIWLRKER